MYYYSKYTQQNLKLYYIHRLSQFLPISICPFYVTQIVNVQNCVRGTLTSPTKVTLLHPATLATLVFNWVTDDCQKEQHNIRLSQNFFLEGQKYQVCGVVSHQGSNINLGHCEKKI